MLRFIYNLIVGIHPNNTIFSYNYHNVSHILKFLKKQRSLVKANSVLIDVGAGLSPYYSIFSELVGKYISVDMEESLPKDESRAIEQRIGMAEKLPLDDEIADVVMSNQVLEHVLDPIKSAEESYRVLKKGGVFIGSVPHISPVHLEPYDFRRYTDLGLKQLLENVGFTNIHIEGNGGVHRAAALMVLMDWMLSKRKDSKGQKFNGIKSFILFPLVGLINIMAIIFDFVFGDKKRSPANLCWIAYKPN
ncbi:MAG: class I SAM-dependent methyltransferase [Bacteroidia bacterium]|nr:class I SAM-dependent methyltransferase [Bacteroidia bacterium]NNC84444.1 class I SAM-dependent methyltransferase [Bacteroidia bacterium]